MILMIKANFEKSPFKLNENLPEKKSKSNQANE